MALNFDGNNIPGRHGPPIFPSPELTARPVKFFQVGGEGQVLGKPGGRPLTIRVLLHNKFTEYAKLRDKLKEMDDWIGINGTLYETAANNTQLQILDYLTFDGYDRIPLDGQAEPGPLFDYAGGLEPDGTAGWFILLMLRFRQLRHK